MDEHCTVMTTAAKIVARIDSIPILLPLAHEISGRKVALLVRLSGDVWTVGAMHGHNGNADADMAMAGGSRLRVDFGPPSRPLVITRLNEVKDRALAAADPVECSVASPINLANGRCVGLLCALGSPEPDVPDGRVVSMFKRLSALIAQQLDQVAAQERDRSDVHDERAAGLLREQFIAILGHDLRDPLQAISMCSDFLAQPSAPPQVSSIASRIKANARRMSLLIDEVLDFSRARLGGGLEMEFTDVEDINGGLATVVQELQDAQPGRQIISSISVERPVRCDMGKIQQVVSNLLGNALVHGRPHSAIKISARDDENDLVLEVWNAGEPIPPESIGKIFEPFWRHSTSANRNGLGLGLHICSHIVRAHAGSITVTSSRETGTRFTARLPLSPLVPAHRGLARAQCTEGTKAN